jgi:hypothetical protein
MYKHESNTQTWNIIIFPKLKSIKFGRTNYLVIYLIQNYFFSYNLFYQMNYMNDRFFRNPVALFNTRISKK